MYILGDITFEGLRGFDRLSKTNESVYAELPLVGGKPRLQRTGTALQTVDVAIVLHAAFTDPAADIAALNAYREDGTVLPLITGEGQQIGEFVIVSVDDTVVQTAPNGRTLTAEVSLSLREHYDPNKLGTLATAAVKNAFAVGTDKVVPVRLVRVPVTSMGVVSQQANAGNAASLEAVKQVRRAQADASQQASLFQRAKQTLEQATKAYQTAKDTANAVDNITAKAPQLVGQMDEMLGLVGTLATSIAAGDLTNALSNADLLEAAVADVEPTLRPINVTLITRQPQ
jgi:phage protein U